jgi:hypothetical protein
MDSLAKFWRILNDGTVEHQDPDGREIVASMKRAIIKGEQAEWSQTCFCDPPLRHERATIYDRYFTNLTVEPLSKPVRLEGQRFWEYLQDHSLGGSGRTPAMSAIGGVKYVPIRMI